MPEAWRTIEPRPVDIVRATDLGSVQTLKHGNVFLLTDPFGDVHPDARGLGLYHGDTRSLSSAVLRIDGERPVLLQAAAGGDFRGTIQLTNPSADRNPAAKVHPLDEAVGRTIGIARERTIGNGALEERVRFVNHGSTAVRLAVTLDLGADFADIFEVRGYPRPVRGRMRPIAVSEAGDRITFGYDGRDDVRRTTHIAFGMTPDAVAAIEDGGPDELDLGASVRVRQTVALEPGGSGELHWTIWMSTAAVEADVRAPFPDVPLVSVDEASAAYHAWERGTTAVTSDDADLDRVVRRSMADLRLLVNDGPGDAERYVAAGVPWFATLFGRDAIIASLQTLAFRPQIAVETLSVLAAYQATEADPARDAEPGKILHELRTGEMARAGELPHTPYYGSVDATPLWLILLGATFDWTGDRALVDRLWPNALAALAWIDESGDRDRDGFVEYERQTPAGLVNQGWKDSSDAIRDRTGATASTPIALAEVQGFVFEAKRRMARLARIRGEAALAERLESEAETVRGRFEAAFWMDEPRYYAMALDGRKRQADAIASNAGQCLWAGIVAPDRARDVVDRLLDASMSSGWGIRTYAADQPGYNPIGYHTGSVWPFDTSLVAAGMKRYGFDDAAGRLAGRLLAAARQFPDARLPELFCGFDTAESPVPVAYPVACSPQAWSAAAPFLLLTTMLGLRADAAAGELELVHPHLPDWLGSVKLTNLRVGESSVDLLFHRWRGQTSAEVLRKVGDVRVTIRI